MPSGRDIESCSEPSGLPGLVTSPDARPGGEVAAGVSRVTLAQPKRRYRSSARRYRASLTREALLDAAVELIVETGDFRPEASAIAARAKVHKSAINRHFSAIHLMHRVIARERPGAVLEALGLVALDDSRTAALQSDLVWIAMTGRRRDGWA